MVETQTNQTQEEKTPEQTTNTQKATISPENWLKQELEGVQSQPDFESVPGLQFIENQIVEFEISNDDLPFEEWGDIVNKIKKKIIPVTHNKVKKNLWLNTRNPLYKQILEKLSKGETHFKVLQTGNKANTKYVLVDN